ncbi:hypothetical protein [Sphingopyxis terrae]|uniref:hypothetical protein n=1 Tax=Sphingopyxis terrae TaxID=33052 RepID=UPI001C2C492B|nr:hypothetical protein [Sphingopyxis terrae]QXF11241.1 hypothetical protein HBA51_02995 [Sphingopyxis terrae subsp. terrae]
MSGQRSVKLTLGSDDRVFGSYRELEDYAAQLTGEMRTCESQLQHDPRNITLWQQLEKTAEYLGRVIEELHLWIDADDRRLTEDLEKISRLLADL